MNTAQHKPDTLLIVDDQPNKIQVLFDFLIANGYRVLVAQDGESALTKAANADPQLIMLDVMMPGIDRFETCRRLKLDEKTKNIPGFDCRQGPVCSKSTREKSYSTGCSNGQLTELPGDINALKALVQKH